MLGEGFLDNKPFVRDATPSSMELMSLQTKYIPLTTPETKRLKLHIDVVFCRCTSKLCK